jgi:hypothetical protein
MAATYDLDVSMALDDLAWHFTNHYDRRLNEEVRLGLHELKAYKLAALFNHASAIVEPHWSMLPKIARRKGLGRHNWLDSTGIQASVDPLNREFWRILNQRQMRSIMHWWIVYARKYPERCVGGKPPCLKVSN